MKKEKTQKTEEFIGVNAKVLKGIQKKKKEEKANKLVQKWIVQNKILQQQEQENGDMDPQFEDASLEQWNMFKEKVHDEDVLLQLESNIQDDAEDFFADWIAPVSLNDWFEVIWEKKPCVWQGKSKYFSSLEKEFPEQTTKSSQIIPISSISPSLLPHIVKLETFFGASSSVEWICIKQNHSLRYHKWNQFLICCSKSKGSLQLFEPLTDEEALPVESSKPNAFEFQLPSLKHKCLINHSLQLFDMVYVPRGYLYFIENKSKDDIWVLSIQIETKTWSQFMKQALEIAVQKCEEEHLEIRRSLPRRMHMFLSGTNERLQQSQYKSSFVTHFMNSFYQIQHQVNHILPFGEVTDVFTNEFMKKRKALKQNEVPPKLKDKKIKLYEFDASKNEIHVFVKELECIITCSLHDKELVLPMQTLPILDTWIHEKQALFTLQQLKQEYEQIDFSLQEWEELLQSLLELNIIRIA